MIIIRNGLVVDPTQGIEAEHDLVVEGSRIRALERPGSVTPGDGDVVIDAKGCWVTPGLVDLHVHFREPGQEWKETIRSGSRAALLGGYTAVCCMPNTVPSNHSEETTRYILEKAAAAKGCRVYPIGAVSVDLEGKEMAPLSELHEAGCVAFSDDGQPVWDSGLMRRALEWCLMLGVPVSCHEEDKCLSCSGSMNESPLSRRLGLVGAPTVAEDVMVARDIELARYTGGHAHFCHVSTARSAELIRRAKRDGIPVTAEVTPHHLVLTEQAVEGYDADAKMSPPLRSEEDRLALVEALADGTLDAVASDHAPHEPDAKEREFSEAAFGILGLQTSLPLVLDFVRRGALTRKRAVEVLATGPAAAFGLPVGTLRPGAAADLVVIDPDEQWVFDRPSVASRSINSPFLGQALQGRAKTVLVDGDVRVLNGALQGSIAQEEE